MGLVPLYDMEAKQGDTFLRTLTYQDDSGTPIDITGAEAEFSLAPSRGGRPMFTYTQDDYLTVGTTDGVIIIEIPYTVTDNWNLPRLFYEVTLTLTDGKRLTILEGKLKIRFEVVAHD